MRSRAFPALGIGVVAVALATSLTGTASAATGPSAAHTGSAAKVASAQAVCFENMEGDTGTGLTSQNFEASFDQYDTMAADDFKLKKSCTVKSIMVPGQYFNVDPAGPMGPAESETVTVYKNKKGKPGAVVKTQTVEGKDTAGTFEIKLKGLKLKKGSYWVSVQTNQDLATAGQWGWQNSSNSVGAPAHWRNPGDGFGTGCTDWGVLQECLVGVAPGSDMLFSLTGK